MLVYTGSIFCINILCRVGSGNYLGLLILCRRRYYILLRDILHYSVGNFRRYFIIFNIIFCVLVVLFSNSVIHEHFNLLFLLVYS